MAWFPNHLCGLCLKKSCLCPAAVHLSEDQWGCMAAEVMSNAQARMHTLAGEGKWRPYPLTGMDMDLLREPGLASYLN